MNAHRCALASKCKVANKPEVCVSTCFPFVKLHGKGGLLVQSELPSEYLKYDLQHMPFENKISRVVETYVEQFETNIRKRIGLYLYSAPSTFNSKGTGLGKTTSLCVLLKEYVMYRLIKNIQAHHITAHPPAMFVSVPRLQNLFNSQFRGGNIQQQEASNSYYAYKKKMLETDLLGFDDIGVREATPSFLSEMYEWIDTRVNHGKTTLYTSNASLTQLTDYLDERVVSRIRGSVVAIPFMGEDQRKLC